MKPAIVGTILILCSASLVGSQASDAAAKFIAADIAVSPKAPNPIVRQLPARDGRYELKSATMVDLVSRAYGFDPDKVLGGPSWLEMDRFDVTAKLPSDPTPDGLKLMLAALLEERFQLKTHKDTKPLPAYALVAGKKLQMKEAGASEETGCKIQDSTGAGSMTIRIGAAVAGPGNPTTMVLGPGGTLRYSCRNMTMAGFVDALKGMFSASVGNNPIVDETGIAGHWNFELSYTVLMSANTERITIFDAVEKLGLKLESKPLPAPVIVVDSVNRMPTPNPPGTAEILPPIPDPTAFEVASIKPSDPSQRMRRMQSQPGGRLVVDGMPLATLVNRAFNPTIFAGNQLVGIPAWAETDLFDIVAKAPSTGAAGPPMDLASMTPMLRALLVDRFKMTYHTEERPVAAYSLVAAKPKMKKADPASRTFCKNLPAPTGSPAGSQVLNCQNITMAQFADRLQFLSPELNLPVLDATGIDGTWDFTLTFSRSAMAPAGAPAPAGAAASDPTGSITFMEALEKQLGLKLDPQKRPMPVIVIDHIEQKPTDN
jgi:uncharacterized protein (TIGR03435 family)